MVVLLNSSIPQTDTFLDTSGWILYPAISLIIIAVICILWAYLYKKQRQQLEIAKDCMERAQQKLRTQVRSSVEQSRKLSTFTAFSALLSQSLEIKQVMKTAIDMVMEIMRVEVVLIFRLNEQTQELRIIAFEGVPDEFAAAVNYIKLGEGFNGRVAETGQPLVIEDSTTDSRLTRQVVKEQNLQAQLIVPLKSRGQIIGTICVAIRSPRQFDATEIELLTALGNQIGVSMENSRLYQEQIAMTDEWRRSEQKYRELFERAHDAIWVQDIFDKVTAINDAGARLVGYEIADMLGKDVREFLSPEGLNIAKEIRSRLMRGEQIRQPYEQRLIKKSGEEVILMLTTNLLTHNNRIMGFHHIARDITKERQLEENLRFYVQQITKAQEDERQRIARELHDSTAQNLIAVLHQLENYYQDKAHLPMKDSRLLWNIQEQLKHVLQEIRQYSRDLRPSILDDLGLLPSVEWLTEELKRDNKIEVTLSVSGQKHRFLPETEVAVFRIIQEALRNIAKHAQATKVTVAIEFKDRETVVTICDNGKGFEVPRTLGELPRTGKLGLVGMQERAGLIGGNLNIQSESGKGTTLTISIPTH